MRQKRAPHDCQQLLEPAYPCATLLGGVGWLVSMAKVGLREPAILWLGYLTQELLVPCIMIVAHRATPRVTPHIIAFIRYASRPLFSALSSSPSRLWPGNTSPSSS